MSEKERIAFNRGLVWATEYMVRKQHQDIGDHEHVFTCQDCGEVR